MNYPLNILINYMNQFSFSSEDDPNESHCLEQEIGFEQIGDWRGNSEQKVTLDEDGLDPMLNQFDMDLLGATAEIEHDFSKHGEYSELIDSLAAEDAFKKTYFEHEPPMMGLQSLSPTQESSSEPDKQSPKQEQQTLPQEVQESQHFEHSPADECLIEQGEQAQTFFQASENTTVVRSTILEQKWEESGRTVLSEFQSVCQSTYNPLLHAFKTATEKIKSYNDGSIGSLDTYCLFFRIKHQQELKRLEILKIQDQTEAQLITNALLQNVYLDQRTVVGEMARRSQQRRLKSELFCEQLDQSINKIKLLLGKASQSRAKKIESLESHLERINRIQKQLIQLLNQSPKAATDGWLSKADIKCDRYLQRKYLHQRESLYLSLITDLREKVINLLNSIFVKEDPIMFAVQNRQLIRYKSLSQNLYGINKAAPPLGKMSTDEIDSSLKEVLQGIIPIQWAQDMHKASNCEQIIESVNNFLNNQIFLPVVELEKEHIRIMIQASWIPNTQKISPQSAKQPNDQKNKGAEWQSTYQNLISERNAANSNNMKVNVVLTIDKYLHLQCGQQIATLKMKKLKLSRKGKSIVVSERNRSIVALFTSPLVLGEIQFDTEQDSSRFIDAVQGIKVE